MTYGPGRIIVQMAIDQNLMDKLIRYCNYRDRCEQEVRTKMRSLDITDPIYLRELKEDDILNEQRYADSFAQGRFRIKYWGKIKIKAHLRQKGVSSAIVDQALTKIDLEEYYQRAAELIDHKWEDVKAKDDYVRKSKVYRYMMQKGYASGIINEVFSDRSGKVR